MAGAGGDPAFQSDDPQVVVIGTIAFRAQCLALPLQPTVVLANMLFQSTGRAFRALFISATRQGIYFLPLILILPRFTGSAVSSTRSRFRI